MYTAELDLKIWYFIIDLFIYRTIYSKYWNRSPQNHANTILFFLITIAQAVHFIAKLCTHIIVLG